MTFRQDINQLRAISVVAVLIFHFQPAWLTGGFAGVDVFFVISGFLITQIISRRVADGTFSLVGFYVDRVNRIFPALLALAIVLLLTGWFVFSALDYRDLAKQLTYSLVYFSNHLFANEAGYFHRDSSEKILLHTWSLSVEWQFYILFPVLFLMLFKKNSFQSMLVVLGLMIISSFIVGVSGRLPEHNNYFILITRAWELLAGALTFFLTEVWRKKQFGIGFEMSAKYIIQALGWCGILVSFLMFDRSNQWPGLAALMVVLSAGLVIFSGSALTFYSHKKPRSTINQTTLSLCFKGLNLIGKSSYSIYVWHWPLAVIGNIYLIPYWRWWGIPLSLVIGILSFLYIEKTAKRLFNKKTKQAILNVIAAAVLAVIALLIWKFDGVPQRFTGDLRLMNESALAAENERLNPPQHPMKSLSGIDMPVVEGTSEERILMIGASHIQQMYDYVLVNNRHFQVWFLTEPGCFVVPEDNSNCERLYEFSNLIQNNRFSRIVVSLYCIYCGISGSEEQYGQQIDMIAKSFNGFLARAKKYSDQVYLITGELFGNGMDPAFATRLQLPNFILRKEIEHHYRWHERALNQLSELDGVTVINPLDYLCDTDQCSTRTEKGEFLHFDASHMRPIHIRERMTYLQPIFEP